MTVTISLHGSYIEFSKDSFIKSAAIPMSKDGMSPDKKNTTCDSGTITYDVKTDILEDKCYQPESNTD